MADLEELNYDDLDELDIETLLARVERKPLTFSRKQNLKQAPEFMQRLSGNDTVQEGQDTQLECVVCAFPHPDLTWYKDSELIQPDHPRMTVVEEEEGKYYLKIKNVCKGDEAGYKCKAENCEGTSASTFFLFVNVKPKRSPKNKNKRRRVSYPPMFSTIVEKVEEEEVAAKEARFAPPSPLSELYVGITLKSRHTWPKFLGEWAFAEDAIRSCSDEADSPPTSPDGTEEKINVKVKVSNKPVKSILKTRRRPGERETSEEQKQANNQPAIKDTAVSAAKKTENGTAVTPSTSSGAKTSTKRTESRKTTTTTTTTTTKTTKTTSTTKTNGKTSASPNSGQALVSSKTTTPAVTAKSETKALESKQQDAISLKGSETKTTTNGSATTTTTASTTKNNTRTLTAHRIEETRQTVKQSGGADTKTTPSGAGPGKPSPQEQVAVKKAPTPSQTKSTELITKDSASPEEKKPLTKTQSLQERLIKKTTQTSTASAKKISTGSLGISKITEKLTGAPATQKDNGAAKTSPTKELKSSPTKVIATTSSTGQKASTVSQSSTLTTSSASMKSVTQTTKSTTNNGAIRANGPLKSVTPTTTAPAESPPKQLTTVNQSKPSQPVVQPASSSQQPTQQQPPSQRQPQTTMAQKTTTTQQTQATQKLTTSQTATVPKTVTTPQTSTVTVPKSTTTKSTAISTSTTTSTQSTVKTNEVRKPATLALKTNEVRALEASPTKQVPSPSPTPSNGQIKLASTPVQNQTPKGNGQPLPTASVKSPVIELPVTHQTGSPHNMALPGKPTPESNDPKYKTTTMIKTTQQNQVSGASTGKPDAQKVTSPISSAGTTSVQNVTSPTPSSVETGKAPRLVRQESVGVMVVNKLVVDQKNQDGRRRRERSPVVTHTVTATVRSRETSPATQRTRVRRERGDRGKSPIMQLLPTDPRPKSPATSQPSVPSPVRYLPIISVKERPTEKVIVHQPTVASQVIDLRGIGNAKTGEIQQPKSNIVVQRSITTQPVEFVKPFGTGKDPIQGLKQTFTTQEMQTQKAETSCDDPKAGIKRSISTEKLHLIDRNTDVIASATMGPVGAKAAVVDTDVIRTKLITEQPAVPSDRVQPGLVPVQATQKEILTKETTKRTVMEVGKNNLPKGTVMIAKPGSLATTKIEAPVRKTSLVESLTSRYNTSTPSSGSASPYPSRSPSPNRMIHGDNSWQSKPQATASPQPNGRPDSQLHFKPVDPNHSPQIVLSPGENQNEIVLGGSSWNTRQAPMPPKRGSSVERMLTTYNASPTRKTSLLFTPYFSRTEPKKPVDITQYLSQGQNVSRMDRSRRAQSEDRLPSIPMYPSRGAMSPPQRPPPPNWSFAAPLNRSVSVDVIPGLVETDRGFSTYQEIPVEHHMSPDSAATLPRRRKRRNSVELLTQMFDGGTPVPVDASQGGASTSNQYQDMGQQLLTQIQAFGDASYDFEEGATTLPRTKDSHGGPRLKRRNSVGHMAKIFDQGVPVVKKDEDAIPIYGGSMQSLPQAPVNVVHPYTDMTPHNSRPPEARHQPAISSRLSASTPHLASSISRSPTPAQHRTTASFQQQNKTNPVANQTRTRRAAACSLNLKNVSGVGSPKIPSVLNQRANYRRSLSEQPQSPQKVMLRHHQPKSAEAEEVKSYKRLSVGEAARLFDQTSPESPPPRKNPSLAQKFLAKFK